MKRTLTIALAATAFCASGVEAKECGVVRLNYIEAIKASSGTSNEVIGAIAQMAGAFENAAGDSHIEIGKELAKNKDPEVKLAGVAIAAAGSMEKGVAKALEHASSVISAIDDDRDDPDDLYMSLSTERGDEAAFWPAPDENTELARVGTKVNFSGIYVPYILGLQRGEAGREIGVNFYDWDGSSRDDHLGQVIFHINDLGEGPLHTAMLGSKHGGSLYGLGFEVIPVTCNPDLPLVNAEGIVQNIGSVYASANTNGAQIDEAILFRDAFGMVLALLIPDIIAYDQ